MLVKCPVCSLMVVPMTTGMCPSCRHVGFAGAPAQVGSSHPTEPFSTEPMAEVLRPKAARDGARGVRHQASSMSSNSREWTVVSLLLTITSLVWYGDQVYRFGFAYDQVDLIGGYFLVSCIAVLVVLLTAENRVGENGFLFLVCALSILAVVRFSGQLLLTFDPRSVSALVSSRSAVSDREWQFLTRGLFWGAACTTLLVLGPRRFLDIPRWLLVATCLVTAGWLFVYACPSIVREWYGTRTEPSELFPDGLLWLPHKNPERRIQGQMFFASVVSWLVVIVVGRIRYRRSWSKRSAGMLPLPSDR